MHTRRRNKRRRILGHLPPQNKSMGAGWRCLWSPSFFAFPLQTCLFFGRSLSFRQADSQWFSFCNPPAQRGCSIPWCHLWRVQHWLLFLLPLLSRSSSVSPSLPLSPFPSPLQQCKFPHSQRKLFIPPYRNSNGFSTQHLLLGSQ